MLQCHVRACPKWWSTTSAFASDGTAYLLFSPDDNIVSLHMHLQERQRTNCQDYLVSNQFQYTQLINSTIYWMVIPVTCESIHELHQSHSSNLLRTELVCYVTEMFLKTFLETLRSACAPLPHTPQMKFMRPASSRHFDDADVWNVGLPITEQ